MNWMGASTPIRYVELPPDNATDINFTEKKPYEFLLM